MCPRKKKFSFRRPGVIGRASTQSPLQRGPPSSSAPFSTFAAKTGAPNPSTPSPTLTFRQPGHPAPAIPRTSRAQPEAGSPGTPNGGGAHQLLTTTRSARRRHRRDLRLRPRLLLSCTLSGKCTPAHQASLGGNIPPPPMPLKRDEPFRPLERRGEQRRKQKGGGRPKRERGKKTTAPVARVEQQRAHRAGGRCPGETQHKKKKKKKKKKNLRKHPHPTTPTKELWARPPPGPAPSHTTQKKQPTAENGKPKKKKTGSKNPPEPKQDPQNPNRKRKRKKQRKGKPGEFTNPNFQKPGENGTQHPKQSHPEKNGPKNRAVGNPYPSGGDHHGRHENKKKHQPNNYRITTPQAGKGRKKTKPRTLPPVETQRNPNPGERGGGGRTTGKGKNPATGPNGNCSPTNTTDPSRRASPPAAKPTTPPQAPRTDGTQSRAPPPRPTLPPGAGGRGAGMGTNSKKTGGRWDNQRGQGLLRGRPFGDGERGGPGKRRAGRQGATSRE